MMSGPGAVTSEVAGGRGLEVRLQKQGLPAAGGGGMVSVTSAMRASEGSPVVAPRVSGAVRSPAVGYWDEQRHSDVTAMQPRGSGDSGSGGGRGAWHSDPPTIWGGHRAQRPPHRDLVIPDLRPPATELGAAAGASGRIREPLGASGPSPTWFPSLRSPQSLPHGPTTTPWAGCGCCAR